jgi:prepilin peptidase CpaA
MFSMASGSITLIGQIAALALGASLLIIAALHDVAARTIPNWTSLLLALTGALLRWMDGQLLFGLALGLVVFVAAAFCWRRGWMGGGDVKLLGAVAIFVPPSHVPDTLIDITLAGGIVGLLYLFGRMVVRRVATRPLPRPRGFLARILRAEHWRLLRGGPLPYASAIAAGTIFVITPLFFSVVG